MRGRGLYEEKILIYHGWRAQYTHNNQTIFGGRVGILSLHTLGYQRLCDMKIFIISIYSNEK